MRVLDLFSGLGGFSQAFKKRGHFVTTVDFDSVFNPNIVEDIMKLDSDFFAYYDVILASPPCNCFSVASISTHWTGGKKAYLPKTEAALDAMKLVRHTISLIEDMKPTYWYLENPRGILRKIIGKPIRTIWLCQFGDERAKPTDLWGQHAPMEWPLQCKNNNPNCNHQRAPRGAKTGTQGRRTAADRAFLPYKLSERICQACEKDIYE